MCDVQFIASNRVFKCRLTRVKNSSLNLPLIAHVLKGKFDSIRFPACTIKCKNPKCTVMIFSSGEMVITGSSSKEAASLASHKIIRFLARLPMWHHLDVYNLRLVNLVCTANLGFKLNMDLFYEDMDPIWEPEVFGGASWKTGTPPRDKKRKAEDSDEEEDEEVDEANPSMAFNVFESGRIVAVGIQREEFIPVAEQRVAELYKYRLGHEYRPFTGVPKRRKITTPAKPNKTKLRKQLKESNPHFTAIELEEALNVLLDQQAAADNTSESPSSLE